MEQMVSNRVWFMGCDVVYGTHVWNREYHAWNMWFQRCMKQEVESCMVVRCEVVYGGDGVESCMVLEVRCRAWNRCIDQMVSNRAWW